MKRLCIGLILASCLTLLLSSFGCRGLSPAGTGRLAYPPAKEDSVVDVYHGARVPDPYRWLEEADSPDTRAWVTAQNELTAEFLSVSARDRIEARLTRLMDYARYSIPHKRGGRYFFWKNDGLQNQSVFYVHEGLTGEPRVVINPNLLSKDGTVAVTATAVSEDGKLLAYGLSRSGSDEKEVRIREVDSGRDFDEVLRWCRFTRIAWKNDGSGFFYNRFPDPDTVAPEDRTSHNRLYWHALGTPQSQDRLIYEDPENKHLAFYPSVTEDGKYLILNVSHGTDPNNRIYYRPIDGGVPFVKLLDTADARYNFVGNFGRVFYFDTDLGAPRGRIIAVDTEAPGRDNWRTLIPESPDVIDRVAVVNSHFVLACMRDVHHQLRIHKLDGSFVREIPLPAIGAVGGLAGKQGDAEMFFSFTSFLFPPTSYRYDFKCEELQVFQKAQVAFEPSKYETNQVFVDSKDGTRVPMFITHRRDLQLTGGNPTLLSGYGGFNISIRPSFSVSAVNWLEMGGVFAVANLRGGAEYGQEWHQAGMLDKKQNVFDDFIAAAEWLIKNRYTRAKKLAIRGGSNGGLLVAACMLQRPDLYGAVVCQVPVTDMLRYHKFTVGRYWIPEYGSAEASPDQFEYLYAYSPLHNIRRGAEYPPILVTSADTDDRVVPAHAKKFVATLQAEAAGKNPILLRVDTKAGHGGGKPTSKIIEEQADIYAFLARALSITD
ncbi:MAG: S9 family peptidase [Phycisphaerales bacterium]|nr:MAG: S9 family peptidase [Phycisphaerales bacterium]